LTIALLLVVAQPPAGNAPGAAGIIAQSRGAKSKAATFLPCDEGTITTIAFSPDGKIMAAGYSRASNTGGGVVLWDLIGRKRIIEKSLPVTEGSVRKIGFSPDGKTLAAGYAYVHGHYSDGGVVVWDVAQRRRVLQAPIPRKDCQVGSVAFSPDGKTLAALYIIDPRVGGGVVLWDLNRRNGPVEKLLPVTEGTVTSIAFSPDGKTLAGGLSPLRPASGHGGIGLWDVAGRKLLTQAALAMRGTRVESVTFNPDGKTVTAGYSLDSHLAVGAAIWHLAERRFAVQETVPATEGVFSNLAVSPDSKFLAAGCSALRPTRADGRTVLWDVAGKKLLIQAAAQVRGGRLNHVEFSPDGQYLANVFVRNAGDIRPNEVAREQIVSVNVWNVEQRKALLEGSLPVTYGNLNWFAFSPDCKTLLASYSFPRGLTIRTGILLWELGWSSKGPDRDDGSGR
jgi:WD40 repeat protein